MANDYLNSILQNKPVTWTDVDYTGKNCVTVKLHKCSSEYIYIHNVLQSKSIVSSISNIERVQHPFAYGRFLIRKDQMEKRFGMTSLTIVQYYTVSKSEVKEALEYNLDNRRTPSLTFVTPVSFFNNDVCVIISQRLYKYEYSEARDSEEYPEYVIYFD